VRPIRAATFETAKKCESCQKLARLKTIEVRTLGDAARRVAGKIIPAREPGWCPLIALCEECWESFFEKLKASDLYAWKY
jgi:hypothetical protein